MARVGRVSFPGRDDSGNRKRTPPHLAAAELLYGCGAAAFHGIYDRGWRKTVRLPVPVISLGNLTAGGTGKTPAVLALCRAALNLGYRPAVLTRAYRARSPRGAVYRGMHLGTPATARTVGDEPLLLSRALPEVPILLGKDRVESARRWLDGGETVDLFLLDDGFQHRRLARDADIVLLDSAHPLGNGRLLPAGPLREPPSALRRATHLLFTGTGGVSTDALGVADTFAPTAIRLSATTRAGDLRALDGGRALAPVGARVHAVCGIARPERFRETLREAGAEVVGWSAYPDHHRFRESQIRGEESAAAGRGAMLVTTVKDAGRVEGFTRAAWFVLETSLELKGGWEALLQALL